MEIALTFIKKHWRLLAIVGAILAAYVAGRMHHHATPAAQCDIKHDAQVDTTKKADTSVQKHEDSTQGPVVIKTHTVYKHVPMPGPADKSDPCPGEVTQDVEETHGPVVTKLDTNTAQHTEGTTHEVVHDVTKLVPMMPPKPDWAIGVALQDPFHGQYLHLEVDHRLFGNLWATAGATPSHMDFDLGLKVEF